MPGTATTTVPGPTCWACSSACSARSSTVVGVVAVGELGDAGAERHALARRLVARGSRATRREAPRRRVRSPREDEHELVRTESVHAAAPAPTLSSRRAATSPQDRVGGLATEALCDVVEAVDVEHDESEGVLEPVRIGDLARQALERVATEVACGPSGASSCSGSSRSQGRDRVSQRRVGARRERLERLVRTPLDEVDRQRRAADSERALRLLLEPIRERGRSGCPRLRKQDRELALAAPARDVALARDPREESCDGRDAVSPRRSEEPVVAFPPIPTSTTESGRPVRCARATSRPSSTS